MGNGLFQLLTSARLSDASEMPLWQELWQYFNEKYFTLDLTQYENLGLSGGGLFSVPQMVIMMLIGVMLASGCGTSSVPAAESSEEIAVSSAIRENASVSYLGPAGTYTEEAAQFFFPKAGEFLPESTVPEAIADVVSGKADYAVIPQENNLWKRQL